MGQVKKFQDDESDLGVFRREHQDWELTEYEYNGFKVVRADKPGPKKRIKPFQPDGSFGYPKGDKNGSRPLYNLKELSRSRGKGGYNQKVIIVEGEKCVEHAEKVFPDCPVVTWPGGTGATDKTNWKPLQTRSVLILADTDEVGRNAARRIEKKLKKEDCTVTVYSREGEDGRDIFDWIEGKSASEIAELREEILAGNSSARSDVQASGKFVGFEDIEPWPDEVSGSEVLSSLADLINRHMYIKPEQADATALWCAMAWLHDDPNLELAPFLNITAPSSRAGKTALLDIVAEIVPRPFPLVGASEAFLFRVIEEHAPTLLLDEIDTQRAKKNGEGAYLDGMLNGSQTRRTATIGRMAQIRNGQAVEQVAVTFSTWCPKVLCGIGGLADTTVDRSIQIRMERKPKTELRPRWRNRDRQAVMDLCRKIGTWVKGNADEIITARGQVKLPKTINDRQWDSWEVLGAIAKVAGGDWPKRAVAACKYITDASEDTRSYGELLIGDLSAIFSHKEGEGFITSAVICEFLNKMEERPWSNWNKGRGFNPSALARKLKPFDIKPRQKKQRGSPQRGYDYEGLEPLFSRYPVTEGDNPMENIGNFGNGSEEPI